MRKCNKIVLILFICVFLVSMSGKAFSSSDDVSVLSLLNQSIDSRIVKEFINGASEGPVVSEYYNHIHYRFDQNGIEFLFVEEKLNTIFLYSERYRGHNEFRGVIPNRLRFSDSKEAIHKEIGPPSDTGLPLWEKWLFSDYALHIQYLDGRVSMITLMVLEKEE